MKLAIVGSGISGLAVVHTLAGLADITLFEAGDYFGGHTHTVDVTLPNSQGTPTTHAVDTGFLVFNERTYPNLINLFEQLGVVTAKSDMSFSVKVPSLGDDAELEWSGCNLNTVFAQRANLFKPRFWRMLADLVRFNGLATGLANAGKDSELMQPLGDFLARHRFSQEFRDWYFLPMIGCIWSCPTDQMLQFPVGTLVRFCHNHGLIQVTNRPQWWTVAGGARNYVEKIVAKIADARLNTPVQMVERDAQGVRVITQGRAERFDKLVLATHSDQALALLRDPSALERETLGAIRYQPNRAVLHTDTSVLPRRQAAWAAWNYERPATTSRDERPATTSRDERPATTSRDERMPMQSESAQVCLHCLLNRLQPLPWVQPIIVSLNPVSPIAPDKIIDEYSYAHPVFDLPAAQAQKQLPQLQGQQHTYFCGAWTGYGFHEDGLKSGLAVARHLLVDPAGASA